MISENTIRPELVAGKLAEAINNSLLFANDIKNNPRLVETIWFVQWYSFHGGLRKLVDDLLEAFPERFVTESMKAAGQPRNGRYTLAQCWKAWDDFDDYSDTYDSELGGWLCSHHDERELPANPSSEIRAGLEKFNWEYLLDICHSQARSKLPIFLKSVCEDKHTDLYGRWYCPDLFQVLLDFMDRHAAQERKRIATTEVVEKVFDAVDYAWSEKKLVRIVGNSRFGKSESLRTWAAMYPGRVRLVTVPCSNAPSDLHKAIAESLGMATSFGTNGQQLRSKVEFVLEHGQLGILADESHFLFPLNLTRNTPPHRLNWVRTAIVDRRLPCVLCATPQDYNGQAERFEKKTKYNMAQFLGRESLICKLPEKISKEDLTACLKVHFPEMNDEDAAKRVVSAAMKSQSFVQALADIASRTRWRALKRGVTGASLADLKAAIEDVTGIAAAHSPEPCEPAAKSPRTKRQTADEVIAELRPGARISQPETEADLAVA